MLKCEVINLRTKEVIKARSISEFCRIVGMNDYRDKIHMYPVVRGQRLHHRGWALLKYAETELSLKDIYGNTYSGSLKDLLFKYKIPANRVWNLMLGKKKVFQGLFLADTKVKFIAPNPIKILQYQLLTPNDKILKSNTIIGLSRQLNNEVAPTNLYQMIHGRAKQTKGYTLHGFTFKRKSVLENFKKTPVIKTASRSYRKNKDVRAQYSK